MRKWVININDGPLCDVTFCADANFIRMLIHSLNRSDDENVKDILIPKLEAYLDECKNKQHVYLIFSDNGVYNDGPLDTVRPETEFIEDEDMKL